MHRCQSSSLTRSAAEKGQPSDFKTYRQHRALIGGIGVAGAAAVVIGLTNALGAAALPPRDSSNWLGVEYVARVNSLPAGVVVAYANSHPITMRAVARRAAERASGYEVDGQTVPPAETNREAVIIIAHQLALFQAAKAAGIHISTSRARALAEKELHIMQTTPQSAHLWQALQAVMAGLGLTEQQYIQKDLIPGYQQLLTVGAMQRRIMATVPQGSMSSAAWFLAKGQAVKEWEQKVYAALLLKVVKPGY